MCVASRWGRGVCQWHCCLQTCHWEKGPNLRCCPVRCLHSQNTQWVTAVSAWHCGPWDGQAIATLPRGVSWLLYKASPGQNTGVGLDETEIHSATKHIQCLFSFVWRNIYILLLEGNRMVNVALLRSFVVWHECQNHSFYRTSQCTFEICPSLFSLLNSN